MVGKTAILNRYTRGTFQFNMMATTGIEIRSKEILIDDQIYIMKL